MKCWERRIKLGESYRLIFKIYYKATDTKTAEVLVGRRRHTGQWNRIGNPEIDPHKYIQLIFFLTKAQKRFNGERMVFSTNYVGTMGHSQVKKKKKEKKLDLTSHLM